MTPEELRRRARGLRALAGSRLRGSDDVTVVVRACEGGLDDVERRSRAAWSGRASEGFHDVAGSRRRDLAGVLEGLRRTAAELDQEADGLLDEALSLERRADELEAALVA